jgi:hypothetical protein
MRAIGDAWKHIAGASSAALDLFQDKWLKIISWDDGDCGRHLKCSSII